MLEKLIFEWLGTAVLICLGNGVCANVTLKETLGKSSDWIVVAMGWSMAVYGGVLVSQDVSGAHLNPAVTLALSISGQFSWDLFLPYIGAQMLGAMTGSFLVFLIYKKQFDLTAGSDEAGEILGVFATGPKIASKLWNLTSETLSTMIFITMVFYIEGAKLELNFISASETQAPIGLGSVGALPVALVVLAIGLSLGGPTGYAINPARDLGPRIVYSILPLDMKKDAQWSYSWIPVIGPMLGAAMAAGLYTLIAAMS